MVRLRMLIVINVLLVLGLAVMLYLMGARRWTEQQPLIKPSPMSSSPR